MIDECVPGTQEECRSAHKIHAVMPGETANFRTPRQIISLLVKMAVPGICLAQSARRRNPDIRHRNSLAEGSAGDEELYPFILREHLQGVPAAGREDLEDRAGKVHKELRRILGHATNHLNFAYVVLVTAGDPEPLESHHGALVRSRRGRVRQAEVEVAASRARRASTDVLDDAAALDGERQGVVPASSQRRPDVDKLLRRLPVQVGPIYVSVVGRQEQAFQRPRS